jgi:4-hydroxy-tetrahydrodipicolinate reductase
MQNLLLIGYGKMGQRIEALSADFDFEIATILTRENNRRGSGIEQSSDAPYQVAIDFSSPNAAPDHVEALLDEGIPTVFGTTGWLHNVHDLDYRCKKAGVPMLYGSNFSLGVQLFAEIVSLAGSLFGKSELFDSAIHEIHHTDKADAPSGTAYTLAKLWKEGANKPEQEIQTEVPSHGKVNTDDLYVTSQRLGSVFGEHQVRINSPFDDIELTHRARSRDAFASGALKAARWLIGQNPGFYKIEDVVEKVTQMEG